MFLGMHRNGGSVPEFVGDVFRSPSLGKASNAMTQEKPRFKNYLAGVSTGQMRMVVQTVVGLWLVPFTLHYLDREKYAIFSLTLSVFTWLGLLDFGITAGLRVQAARLTGQPDKEAMSRLASSAFFAQCAVVVAVLAVGGVIGAGFAHFFAVRPELRQEATWVFLLTVLGAAMSVGSQTFSALLIAHQQVHVDNLIGLLLVLIRTVLTVVLLKWGWGLYSLAVAHVAARGVTAVFAVVRTYRTIPGLQIRYRLASWGVLKGTANLGVWFTLGSVAAIFIGSLDSAVTAKVVSLEMVTTLALTSRLYDPVGGLVFVITETARPMLGQMLGQNKMVEALAAYRRLFAMSTGLAVVFSLAVWAGNCAFVNRWVGAANYGGLTLDLVVALNLIMHMWVMPSRAVLSANLELRPQCLARLFEGALNLGLSIVFGLWLGVVGVMLATLLAGLLCSMWYLPYLTARMFNRPFLKFIWEDVAPIAQLLMLLCPLALLARVLAQSLTGYAGAFVGCALTGGAGLVLLWFIVCDEALRAQYSPRWIYEQKLVPRFRSLVANLNY